MRQIILVCLFASYMTPAWAWKGSRNARSQTGHYYKVHLKTGEIRSMDGQTRWAGMQGRVSKGTDARGRFMGTTLRYANKTIYLPSRNKPVGAMLEQRYQELARTGHFRKALQILAKKFSAQSGISVTQINTRIASQRIQGRYIVTELMAQGNPLPFLKHELKVKANPASLLELAATQRGSTLYDQGTINVQKTPIPNSGKTQVRVIGQMVGSPWGHNGLVPVEVNYTE